MKLPFTATAEARKAAANFTAVTGYYASAVGRRVKITLTAAQADRIAKLVAEANTHAWDVPDEVDPS